MNKYLIICFVVINSYALAQVDSLDTNPTIDTKVDPTSYYEKYYQFGYNSAIDDFSMLNNKEEVPAKYASGLSSEEWNAFKEGYYDGLKINRKINKKYSRECATCGLAGVGAYAVLALILTIITMNMSG